MIKSPFSVPAWRFHFLLAFWTILLASCLSVRAVELQHLRGRHVPAATTKLAPVHRLNSAQRLDLVIGLPLRNTDQLTNFLHSLYDPANPNFRHFLKPDQFTAAYGPSESDYQSIVRFAQTNHLTIRATHANRTLLDVSGSVADIENAFHVHLQVYQHPTEKRTFFAPDREPTVDIATPILAISGLDNYVLPKPRIHPDIHPLGGGASGGGGGSGGTGDSSMYMGYDFRSAYVPGVDLDGTGQSIGLFELTGYDPDDISQYESDAGLPDVQLQNVLIDGFDGDDTNIDYAVECTADIQMSISMAPGLDKVIIYEGPTPLYETPLGTNGIQYAETTAQINDVFDRMATDDAANQLSSSYEMDINLSTIQIFEQFAAQGQSFFQGSGDFGAYGGYIDEPADDPYITVVGGTTLNTSGPGGPRSSEVVWLTPAGTDELGDPTPEEASGGGSSYTYAIPDWQQGISMTANQGSTTMRNSPDVSLVANNVEVEWGNDNPDVVLIYGGAIPLAEAGTSLATPLWAGFMALVNQQAALNSQPPVGFVNPTLYAIAKSTNYSTCFYDVISGNNFTTASPNKYSATIGYDLCSGLGTINGSNLIHALLAPPAENLVVKPPLGFTAFGPGGGPFSVSTETYTLSNIGTTPLNWSLANTSAWLNVTANSGTLAAGASTTVTVSLNATANSLLIDHRSDNVVFSDLTDGMNQNRQFDLYVGNGGFETGDLTDWTLVGDTNLIFALASDDLDVAGADVLGGEPDELFVHSGLYGGYLGENPDEGSLTHSLATTTGKQYLVSFWLTSVPYQGETTPNNFSATWNGTTLFAQSNLPAFGWTNLQYVVTATSASSSLQFTMDNVPGAFGLDDVTVQTVPAPMLQSAGTTAGALNFTWQTIPNSAYQIQSATSLFDPNWVNVGSPITATNGTMSIAEPLEASGQQFYRVILLPPQ